MFLRAHSGGIGSLGGDKSSQDYDIKKARTRRTKLRNGEVKIKTIELVKLDDAFEQYLSRAEIEAADAEAEAESKVLFAMLDDVSKMVVRLMQKKDLSFRAFAKENELSLSMATKIIKGSGGC